MCVGGMGGTIYILFVNLAETIFNRKIIFYCLDWYNQAMTIMETLTNG